MPSIMVYVTNEVYDYLYTKSKESGETPSRVIKQYLERMMMEEKPTEHPGHPTILVGGLK